MPYEDGKIVDYIDLEYTLFPLPYHHSVWLVHKLVPYFEDKCLEDESACQMVPYIEWCFENQETYLDAKDKSQEEIIEMLCEAVSNEFKYDKQELLDCFHYDTDKHDSEMRTRFMWKYGASKGVSGDPHAFVNGVHLNEWPGSADNWMTFFKDIINSRPSSS